MKFVGLSFVLLAIVLVANADNTTDQANKYADQIIPTIIKTKHLDPLKIDHYEIGVIVHGILIDIKMKNITVQGLSHIYRNGNAVMKNNSNIIDIQLQLNDKNIIVTSDLNVKTDIKNFENLNCQISYDNIHINFKFEKNHDQFNVKEFKIVHFENCQVNIQGSSEVEAYKEYYNDEACRQMRTLINQSINKA